MHKLFGTLWFAMFFVASALSAQVLFPPQGANGWIEGASGEKGFFTEFVSEDKNCIVSVSKNGKKVRIQASEKSKNDFLVESATVTSRSFLKLIPRKSRFDLVFREQHDGNPVQEVRGDDGTPDIIALKYAQLAQRLPAWVKKSFKNHFDLK